MVAALADWKERGEWHPRKADADKGEGEGWLWEGKEGRKTKTYDSPGGPKHEAIEIEARLQCGDSSDDSLGAVDTDAEEAQAETHMQEAREEIEQELSSPTPDALFDTSAPAPLRQEIHPASITTHPSTLMRAGGLDEEHVEDLQKELRRGSLFPPVDIFFDGTTHWLGDGNHRHAAALREGVLLDVEVHEGGLREAILFAVRSNASHGLKRTNDDKRLAVVTLLSDEKWSQESDTTLAEMADVTQPFVGKVQGWLEQLVRLINGERATRGEDEGAVDDKSYADETQAPEGLVRIVRLIPPDRFEALAHNVIARATSRTDSSGKSFSVQPRPPAPEAPELFQSTYVPEPDATRPDVPVVAAEAPEPASAEASQESVPESEKPVVHDRRRFAEELPSRQHVEAPTPSEDEQKEPSDATPADAAPPAPEITVAPHTTPEAEAAWKRATVKLEVTLFPDDADKAGRRVMVVARQEGGAGAPVTKLFRGEESIGSQVLTATCELREKLPVPTAVTVQASPAKRQASKSPAKTTAKKTASKSASKGAAKPKSKKGAK
jgi:hypothetical protein